MNTIAYHVPVFGFLQWLKRLFSPRRFRGKLYLPSNWSEMTDSQVIQVCHLLFEQDDSAILQRLKALKILLDMPESVFNNLSREVMTDLRLQIEWIWRVPLDKFTSFSFKEKDFYLPSSIGDMVAAEYAAAESQLKALLAPGELNGHKLNELVATICRPMEGKEREQYSSKVSERRAMQFRYLDIKTKMAVFKWFLDGIKAHQAKYKILWEKPGEGVTQTPAAKALESFGFYRVLMDLAESQVFGDWEKTNYTSITTIFTYLVKKRLENMEAQRLQREAERRMHANAG